MSKADGNVEYLTGKRLLDLTRSFQISEGSKIVPNEPRQPVHTAKELIELATAAHDDFITEIKTYAAKSGMHVYDPGVKSLSRINEKATTEKGGNVDLINDALRVALIGNKPSQIQRALDLFRPATNSRVLDYLDQFSNPDASSGQRRAKIIYSIPFNGVALNTEIQIWSSKMLEAQNETHGIYRRQRSLKACLYESGCDLAYNTVGRLERENRECQMRRIAVHNLAATNAGLDRFLEKRTFGEIEGQSFVAIEYPHDDRKQMVLLRPDETTGTYVRDNSLVHAFESGNYKRTSRDSFLTAAHHTGMVFERAETMRQQRESAKVLPIRQFTAV